MPETLPEQPPPDEAVAAARAAASATGGIDTPVSLLTRAMRRAIAIQNERAELSDRDKELSSELNKLKKKVLPDLLAQIQSSSYSSDDGLTAALETKIQGSLSNAPNEEAAVKYLRENDFKGAMKTELALAFDEDERETCQAVAKMLAKELERDVGFARRVHPSTLKSWATSRLSEGKPVDLETVGLVAWRQAVVKEK